MDVLEAGCLCDEYRKPHELESLKVEPEVASQCKNNDLVEQQ